MATVSLLETWKVVASRLLVTMLLTLGGRESIHVASSICEATVNDFMKGTFSLIAESTQRELQELFDWLSLLVYAEMPFADIAVKIADIVHRNVLGHTLLIRRIQKSGQDSSNDLGYLERLPKHLQEYIIHYSLYISDDVPCT
jgi:hypothetical protein